jgi:hypothetical protein
MDPNVSLRPEQIERLAQYIANPRFLDLSDPGTGKTPPVCTYIWYVWKEHQQFSLWTQPKSLLGKNRRELLRWTEFKPDEVVILRRNWEPITGPTNLPTMERVKEVQYADEVIIRQPGDTNTRKGDTLPYELIVELNDVVKAAGGKPAKYDFNWVYEVTAPGDTDLAVGMPIAGNMLSDLNKELKAAKKKQVKGRRTYRKAQLTERVIDAIAAARVQGAKAILCSFHFHRENWERLLEVFPELGLLAIDELHMGYGGIDSQNTAALYGTTRHCQRFIGMTGTLLNGKLDSVFPAIYVIEPLYYPRGYADFRAQHVAFEDDYGRVIRWKNEAKVGQILLNHGVRRTFEEVYGKEDVVFLPADVDMNPLMREAYDEFHEAAMLELHDGRFLDGTLPGVATIRARQIIAHPETFGLCKGEMTGKDEWLEIQVIDAIERGENLLIFSVHIPEQLRIVELLKKMGRRVGLMNSTVSGSKRDAIDLAFQGLDKNGNRVPRSIDDVVGSPQTMAVGWNWEHVDHVIPVSYDYQDVNWLQSYRRASRGTRTKTLRVTFPRYFDSVDFRVLDIIYEKSVLANKVDPTRPILQLAA